MLHIWRRHEKSWCSKTSKKDNQCVRKSDKDKLGKLKKGRGGCPIYSEGTLQDGTVIKPRPLNTRNWGLATQRQLEMEAGVPEREPKKTTLLTEAANVYCVSKNKKSADRQRKIKQECERVIAFLAALKPPIINVEDVTHPSLILYLGSWTESFTTPKSRRENLSGFFRVCVRADYNTKKPGGGMPTNPKVKPQTDV